MRAFRRVAVALALTAPLLFLNALPAHADTCYFNAGVPPVPGVWYPCPGPQDQPVGSPVWATTEYGPGWEYTTEWDFIKIERGGHIIVANVQYPTPIRFHGNGFDSGYLSMGEVADVSGVSSLPVGYYTIHNEWGTPTGRLIVVEPTVCTECIT